MQRRIAYIFLAVYFLAATEAHQLLKLPVVWQHFSEHRAEDRHISFLAFLSLHYFNGDPKDDDYERDMQLPFKTSENCMATASPVTLPSCQIILLPPQEFFCDNRFPPAEDAAVPPAPGRTVFQPPRA